jgi:plasmid maintenance system antidote protein VapI
MNSLIEKYKGIHPGFVMQRLLEKRSISQRPFALSINEHPQTLNAISKGRRKLNTALALKIETKLKLEEGTLALLQTYYEIAQEKNTSKLLNKSIPKLRKSLFWDTEFKTIDWETQKQAVILRVFERGNNSEKEAIKKFYSQEIVSDILKKSKKNNYQVYQNTIK